MIMNQKVILEGKLYLLEVRKELRKEFPLNLLKERAVYFVHSQPEIYLKCQQIEIKQMQIWTFIPC